MSGYLKCGLLGVIAYFFASSVLASPGTDWLQSQLTADGGFQNASDIATPFQSTAETLRTFDLLAVSVDTAASLQFINNETLNNTENLSRKIIANADAGNNVSGLIGQLLLHRNRDGGFGDLPGYDSNALDTALALEALAVAGQSGNPAAGFAVGYLLNSQNTNGGWSLGGNEPSVYVTALALRAVWHYRLIFNVGASVDRARNFLLGQRAVNGLWGEVFESALSLIAIVPSLADRSGVEMSVNALRQLQQADGSFGDDVYQTALALRALRLAELPSPDEIRVSGRVLDGDTGLPLAGVQVSLLGASTLQANTGADGRFVFNNIAAGGYQFSASLPGYSALTSGFVLRTGQQVELGDLPLLKVVDNPTTGAVIGRVTRADNGSPLAGATVSVAGVAAPTLTDANGQFQISNIPPGPISIQATAAGFVTATGSANIAAGQTLVFSPALPLLENVQVIVAGTATDRDTGAPLAGVTISVQGAGNDASVMTDAAGQYQIAGLQPGALTLTAALAGYYPLSGTVTAVQNSRIDFSPALVLEGGTQTPTDNSAVTGVVLDAVSGLPLAGVNVVLETSGGMSSSVTEADGRFRFEDLPAGTSTIRFVLSGYREFSAAFELPSNVTLDIGEIRLLDENVTQTAAVRGRVIDSRTSEPLAGVSVIAQFGGSDVSFITGSDGVFEFSGVTLLDGVLLFTLDGYNSVNYGVHLTFDEELDLGDVRLRREDLSSLVPDLHAISVDTSAVISDLQTGQISGVANVDLANRGNAAVDRPFVAVAFYDRNDNGIYEIEQDILLGRSDINDTLPVDQELTIAITVSGVADFRDEPVGVWLDSDEQLVELDETNNTVSASAACRIVPEPLEQSPPVVKWHWLAPSGSSSSVFGPAMVGQLSDDNGDGLINEADVPDVVFVSYSPNTLNAISGADASTLWRTSGFNVTPYGSPSLGDIDGDGVVEVIVANANRSELFAFEHTGELKWRVPTSPTFSNPRDGIAIADLDGDGSPEIVHGRRVYNADGSLRWVGANDQGNNGNYGHLPIVADVDLDGSPEVIAGRTLYSADGATIWHRNDISGDGFTAVGNFDADDFAEIVLVANGRVYLLEHTGETIWGPVTIPGGGSVGAPTVADLDGDGQPEIGVAGARFYVALETDGSIKWTSPTQDFSSHRTGSSVFDFEDDGRVEVLYADERFFRIYDGRNGAILFQLANTSGTTMEYPVVADIDGDNHAEVLIGSDSGSTRGLRALEAENDSWANTRRIWNQHTYHINNINDDGTIPAHEQPSWLSHNTYRLNTFADRDAQDAPDLTVSKLTVIDNGTGQPFSLRARYGNAGSAPSNAGVISRFYNGDPLAGGLLLGSITLPAVQKGQFVDLQLNDVTGIAAGDTLFVVVDETNALEECREDNNSMFMVATGIRGDLQLTLNAAVFPPQADVLLSGLVTNTGSLSAAYTVETRIEDVGGNLVFAFPAVSVPVLAGGASTDVPQTWNTGLTLTGDYNAVAVLRDTGGNILDQEVVAFAISETGTGQPLASLRVTTDRLQYHTTDTVNITDLVRDISLSTLINDARLALVVTGPDASIVFSEVIEVGSLPAGNSREFLTPLSLSAAAQGVYQVNAELADGNGTVLATDNAAFEVIENLLLSLNGAVQAQLPVLYVGDTQVCNYTVTNTGTLDLSAQPLWQLLASIDGQTEVEVAQVTQDIDAGGSADFIRSHDTSGLSPGNYACVLQATINGERQSLAHAVFRLDEPPINLNVDFTLGDRGRLLVLLDEDQRHCHDKGHDPDHGKDYHDRDHDKHGDDKGGEDHGYRGRDGDEHAHKHGSYKHDSSCGNEDGRYGHGHWEYPGLSQQRAWLEQTLDGAGWSYTIVDNQYDFSRELRSGGYTVYALLSEDVKLDNTTLQELREAVFRGEGLLVAGVHDERNSVIDETLGVKPTGKTSAAGIEVLDTGFHSPVEINFNERRQVLKARLEGAEVYARFTGYDKDRDDDRKYRRDDDRDHQHDKHSKGYDNDDSRHDREDHYDHSEDHWKDGGKDRDHADTNIAMAGNAYGEGRTVYAGFDLLREAVIHEAAPDNLFKELLLHTLDTVHPETITPVSGDVLPLRLTVQNMGIAAPGRAVITLPPGSIVLDSGEADAIGEDQLVWSFNLTEGGTADITVYVLPPYADFAPQLFEALIQTGQAPDFIDYDTVELSVTPAAVPEIDALLSDIEALQHVDYSIKQAAHHLSDAQRHFDRHRYEQALAELLKATDKLMQSRHAQAGDIRLQVDVLIKAVARRVDAKGGHWNKGGRDHD